MISVCSDVFDVPAADAVILTLRETATYARDFTFQNLTAGTITIQMQDSPDGATWTNLGVAITLAANVISKLNVTSLKLLRVRASILGGSVTDTMMLSLSRAMVDAAPSRVWTSPLV